MLAMPGTLIEKSEYILKQLGVLRPVSHCGYIRATYFKEPKQIHKQINNQSKQKYEHDFRPHIKNYKIFSFFSFSFFSFLFFRIELKFILFK